MRLSVPGRKHSSRQLVTQPAQPESNIRSGSGINCELSVGLQ